ncbi:hypothetical protein PoB_005923000 [Plakobranchus ocellatus]|uniref:C1q domain-containing protein n=1 Tax=Plakobranchus ocellatus TaxID=259542 RepID=A0AAV4CIN9_9GAST|nr:hypothetical protein PoB_005923000 [Plakobranchus ocellatus]
MSTGTFTAPEDGTYMFQVSFPVRGLVVTDLYRAVLTLDNFDALAQIESGGPAHNLSLPFPTTVHSKSRTDYQPVRLPDPRPDGSAAYCVQVRCLLPGILGPLIQTWSASAPALEQVPVRHRYHSAQNA